jgi:outer membrane protein TolC
MNNFNKMKRFPYSLILIVLLIIPSGVFAQQTNLKLTLEDVIQIAKDQSPSAIMSRHRFRGSYWQYRTHIAKFRPSLTLSSVLPELSRSIDKITLEEGDKFVPRSLMSSSVEVQLVQNIALTGGSVFMGSGLERIDNFKADSINRQAPISYLSTPVSIGFRQPIKGFNSFRWEKRIEPLRYEEAKKDYIDAMENVSLRAVNYFFNLIIAQVNLKIGQINYSSNDTLFKIAQGRYNIGTIAENELLQMELALLNAGTALNEAGIQLEINKFQLRSFLGFNETVNIELLIPSKIPSFEVDIQRALEEAKKNSPEIISLQRQLLEADQSVAQARAEKGLTADLYATYGLTQDDFTLPAAYQNFQDQQRVQVGLEIPIVDWGLGRGRYRMAQSNQELVRTTVQQSEIDFEQQVMLQVLQFNLQDDQVRIAAKADTIAQNRYNVTKQRFLIGKIDVTDLNIALTEKDAATRSYLTRLNNYWTYFYTIRRLTLYDFQQNTPLAEDFDKLVER